MAEGPAKETMQQITAAATSQFPGFKFSPTDEELITYYLRKKLEGCGKSVEVIAEVEICRYEPWDLPATSVIHSENEWFFFSARGRKSPYGTQSRRATELGYWKATGKERNVKAGNRVIGTKRTLVFHKGRAPKGERTGWIMHEFCLVGNSQDSPVVCRLRRITEFRSGDGMSRASLNQGPPSIPGEESNKASVGDTEIRTDTGDAFMSSTSSYGLYSSCSMWESNQKSMNEAMMTESSTRPKGKEGMAYNDEVDDYLSYILNDDLIVLDETVTSNIPTFEPLQPEPLQEVYPEFTSLPGITTTTQIIRPSQPKHPPNNAQGGGEERSSDDNEKSFYFSWPQKCIFTTMVAGKTLTRRLVSGAVVVGLIVVVLAYSIGGWWQVKDLWTDCLSR